MVKTDTVHKMSPAGTACLLIFSWKFGNKNKESELSLANTLRYHRKKQQEVKL